MKVQQSCLQKEGYNIFHLQWKSALYQAHLSLQTASFNIGVFV